MDGINKKIESPLPKKKLFMKLSQKKKQELPNIFHINSSKDSKIERKNAKNY